MCQSTVVVIVVGGWRRAVTAGSAVADAAAAEVTHATRVQRLVHKLRVSSEHGLVHVMLGPLVLPIIRSGCVSEFYG